MIAKDVSFSHPVENILYDEVLLTLAENNSGEEILRFWESSIHFIVLGRISKSHEDINWTEVAKNNIPVFRRGSGGGTVVQGPGCLNYTLILSKGLHPEITDIQKSYAWVLGRVVSALQKIGVSASFKPISDIALVDGEKKISGNAQKRAKAFILHHGTLLYDFDLNKIAEYLLMPKDKPLYRADRAHLSFVANVHKAQSVIKEEIKAAFSVEEEASIPTAEEAALLKSFIHEKNIEVKNEN